MRWRAPVVVLCLAWVVTLVGCGAAERHGQRAPASEEQTPVPNAETEPSATAASSIRLDELGCAAQPCTYLIRVDADGTPVAALSTAPSLLGQLDADEHWVVWAESMSTAIVRRAAIDGLVPPEVHLGAGSPKHPEALLVVDGRIFAADEVGVHEWRGRRDWQTVVDGDVLSVVADDETLTWVRWSANGQAVIEARPLVGGAARPLELGEVRATHLVSTVDTLVWLEASTPDRPGQVVRRLGSGDVEVLSAAEQGPVGLAASEVGIAWVDRRASGRLVRAWRAGEVHTQATIDNREWRVRAREAVSVRGTTVVWSDSAALWRAEIGEAGEVLLALPEGASVIDFVDARDGYVVAVELATGG